MSNSTKWISAISLAGVVALGSYATATKGFGLLATIPWEPLSKDIGFFNTKGEGSKEVSDTYKDKFGDIYKSFLVGLSENNKDWWEKKFKEIGKPTSGKFQDVNDGDSLKNKCNEAYKLEAKNDEIFSENDNNKFKKSDIWNYCSPLGKDVSTLPIGSTTPQISVAEDNNPIFWDIRNKEFHGDGGFEKLDNKNSWNYFINKQSETPKQHIKDICNSSYSLLESTDSNKTKPEAEEIEKYCSFPKFTVQERKDS